MQKHCEADQLTGGYTKDWLGDEDTIRKQEGRKEVERKEGKITEKKHELAKREITHSGNIIYLLPHKPETQTRQIRTMPVRFTEEHS